RRGARRHGQDGAALLARPLGRARVKFLDRVEQLDFDVRDRERRLVELGAALLAEPGEPVTLVRPALTLDHEPPGVGRPDRAMWGARAAEHRLALPHRDVALLAVGVDAPHGDVALELIEDLVARVDVKIVPRVRLAHALIDELALG